MNPPIFNSLRVLSTIDEKSCWVWHGVIQSGVPMLQRSKHAHSVLNLVSEALGAPKRPLYQSCGNPLCVNLDHLEWGTTTSMKGPIRIPENIRAQILKLYMQDGWSQKGLAAKFGIAYSSVNSIIKEK